MGDRGGVSCVHCWSCSPGGEWNETHFYERFSDHFIDKAKSLFTASVVPHLNSTSSAFSKGTLIILTDTVFHRYIGEYFHHHAAATNTFFWFVYNRIAQESMSMMHGQIWVPFLEQCLTLMHPLVQSYFLLTASKYWRRGLGVAQDFLELVVSLPVSFVNFFKKTFDIILCISFATLRENLAH